MFLLENIALKRMKIHIIARKQLMVNILVFYAFKYLDYIFYLMFYSITNVF